jgi:hypothetical protein
MKHLTEEQLILFHYGEEGGRQKISAHLENCEQCRTNYQGLRQTLLLVGATPVPEREASYGAQVWRELRPRLPDRIRPEPDRWAFSRFLAGVAAFRASRLSLSGALVLLVLAAFLAGRFWPQPGPTAATQPGRPSARVAIAGDERVLLKEIGDHLERSQLALIELINSKTNEVVDISLERELAQQLIGVNRLYRRAAARLGDTGSAVVLEELERALIEIANSPAQLSYAEFAEFRGRLDTDDLLFKVKVFGSQVRAREREVERDLAGNRS